MLIVQHIEHNGIPGDINPQLKLTRLPTSIVFGEIPGKSLYQALFDDKHSFSNGSNTMKYGNYIHEDKSSVPTASKIQAESVVKETVGAQVNDLCLAMTDNDTSWVKDEVACGIDQLKIAAKFRVNNKTTDALQFSINENGKLSILSTKVYRRYFSSQPLLPITNMPRDLHRYAEGILVGEFVLVREAFPFDIIVDEIPYDGVIASHFMLNYKSVYNVQTLQFRADGRCLPHKTALATVAECVTILPKSQQQVIANLRYPASAPLIGNIMYTDLFTRQTGLKVIEKDYPRTACVVQVDLNNTQDFPITLHPGQIIGFYID